MFCTSAYDKEKKDEYISDKKLIPDSVIIINKLKTINKNLYILLKIIIRLTIIRAIIIRIKK